MARARPNQLWNEGSTTLYRRSGPPASVSGHVADLAAPALHQADGQAGGRGRRPGARARGRRAARAAARRRRPGSAGSPASARRRGRTRRPCARWTPGSGRSGRCRTGRSRRTSRSMPQARAAGPTSPISAAVCRSRVPVPSKRAITDGVLPQQVDGASRVPLAGAASRSAQLRGQRLRPGRSPRRRGAPGRARSGCRTAGRSGSGRRRGCARSRTRSAGSPRRRPARPGRRCGWRGAPAPGRCRGWPGPAAARGSRPGPPAAWQ